MEVAIEKRKRESFFFSLTDCARFRLLHELGPCRGRLGRRQGGEAAHGGEKEGGEGEGEKREKAPSRELATSEREEESVF